MRANCPLLSPWGSCSLAGWGCKKRCTVGAIRRTVRVKMNQLEARASFVRAVFVVWHFQGIGAIHEGLHGCR